MVRHIEELRPELKVFAFGDMEFLVDGNVKADDTGTDDRVPGGVAKAVLWPAWPAIHKGSRVPEALPLFLAAAGEVRINSCGIGIAGSATILDSSWTAISG